MSMPFEVIRSNNLNIIKNKIMLREYWEEISNLKKVFLEQGDGDVLRRSGFLRPEVAESWIRSKNNGVIPKTCWVNNWISDPDYRKALLKNQVLINVAKPLLDNFMELVVTSGYTLRLFDKDGVVLAGKSQNDSISNVWSEQTTGTTTHSLAILHKKPFMMIGPEDYVELWPNAISFSAPVISDNEVLGALALRQDLGSNPWESCNHRMQMHSLGWVSALAIAIGTQYDLIKINQIMDVTLNLMDESIVTVNQDGTIININHQGSKLLELPKNEVQYHNISEYVDENSTLPLLLKNKEKVDFREEVIHSSKSDTNCLITIRPVATKNMDILDISVVKLTSSQKVNALVASRSGASAKFSFDDIIGESQAIKKAKKMAIRFARTPENILLSGESGTGKELFAQAIHNEYQPSGPFIAVNCAAIPRNLIESELFGYEGGAFTGANKNGQSGKIELAHGGTLFLDEVGDMPYEVQAVLLRVLQTKQVSRLGSNRPQNIDFKLIAATNKNLTQLVQEKLFREDLYFRLSVLTIEIPPLRQRENDITLLAEYFATDYCQRIGRSKSTLDPIVYKKLSEHPWPGNVRQLENAIIYAINVAGNDMIELQHLPKHVFNYEAIQNSLPITNLQDNITFKEYEEIIILNALKRADNNVAEAAKTLGISASSIYRKMKEYEANGCQGE